MAQSKSLVIDYRELAEELKITNRAARQIINDTIRKQKAAGVYIIPSRPPKAARKAVFELLGIEEERQ